MTIESRGTAIAFQSLKAISGVTVRIERGAAVGNTTAVPGDTVFEQEQEDGSTVRLKVRDFIVSRSDFETIIGAGEKPERGDKIIEQVAGFDRTFEAMELGDEVFRWWDKAGQTLRIHTVETSKATTTTSGA